MSGHQRERVDAASYLLCALAVMLTSRTGAAMAGATGTTGAARAAGAVRTTAGAVVRDLLEGPVS